METIKKLMEQRAAILDELDALVKASETESRAFSDEEQTTYDTKIAEIARIDKTIKSIEDKRSLDNNTTGNAAEPEDKITAEERAFVDLIRGTITENRADSFFTKGENGAVIPSSIAHKIITRVTDICPIYNLASRYNIKGILTIPYYDESTKTITMAYADEFTELESSAGEFKSITLTGFLAGVLTLVSKSLINNSDFDVLSLIIERMSVSISKWIEKQMLFGTSGKIEGLTGITQKLSNAYADFSGDDLIDLQEEIPDVYQSGCIWIMSKEMRTEIRKMKDADGNYLLNRDMSSRWGYTLFGKDVYVSEAISKTGDNSHLIIYGDMSGLAVKVSENIAIDVLREKYATQHAIGIDGWLELDAKVENTQKIASLTLTTA